jgi:beta-xylosidase
MEKYRMKKQALQYNRREWLFSVGLTSAVLPQQMQHMNPKIPAELRNATRETVQITGIGQDTVLERHDPSNVIRHNGKYYLWYTEHPPKDGFIGTYVQLATSEDGHRWTVQGTALKKGGVGDPDEQGSLTSYVVPHKGRFYIFYTRVPGSFRSANESVRGIGYAVAESPDGPWIKQKETILWPSNSGWDSLCCDDTNILYREGKWWLYYKGRTHGDKGSASQVGVAISDNLTGPYKKHPNNPLFKGHAFAAWVHRGGVAATGGDNHRKLLWSPDGIHFMVAGNFDNKSVGFYCPENFGDGTNVRGVSWGFDVARTKPRYIYRFDCNLRITDRR